MSLFRCPMSRPDVPKFHSKPKSTIPTHRTVYRVTLLTRNRRPLGLYSRTIPRTLWGSWGGGRFPRSEVPLYGSTLLKAVIGISASGLRSVPPYGALLLREGGSNVEILGTICIYIPRHKSTSICTYMYLHIDREVYCTEREE